MASDIYHSPYTNTYIYKSIVSIYFSIIAYLNGYSIVTLFYLLFNKRNINNNSRGFLGRQINSKKPGWYFGPIFMFLLSPLLDFMKVAYKVFKTINKSKGIH